MRYFKILFIIMLLLGITSCTVNATETAVEQSDLAQPPTPETGKATVIGEVFSTIMNAPFSNVDVRLAEVVRVDDPEVGDDLYVLDQAFSPGAITDINGTFIVNNAEAKEYVIIIGDVERAYEIIQNESGKPKVWNALPDQILNVGVLKVELSKADF